MHDEIDHSCLPDEYKEKLKLAEWDELRKKL